MKFHRRANNEEGAAALEFALVLPLLLMVIFGIIEFGRIYSQYQVYQGAAREGARYAAVRSGAGVGPTATQVRTRVLDSAEPYDGNITSTSINVSTQCSSTNVGTVVTVTWDQSYTIDIPLLPPYTPSPLQIRSAFRCE